MKRLLASAALLIAITACSQSAEQPAAPVEEAAPVAAMEDYLGSWNVTTADGATHVTTNNADGTFTRVYPDGTTDAGTWTFAAEQSCWTAEGEEPSCYTTSEPDITGMLTLTNVADQSVVTASPVIEGVEPIAGTDAPPVDPMPAE